MDHAIIERAERACQAACGIPFETLLAPIDATHPTGEAGNTTGVYAAIKQAREADDATLPLGAWEHELKRADWDRVAQLAAGALAHQGKDLQLAAWLLEAQMHRHGFAAIAGCLHLLHQLCERYWDDLHPRANENRVTRRANIFVWINRKLPAVVRQIPVALGPQEQAYCLADWERARRHDQHRQAVPDSEPEGPASSELTAAMAATPSETYAEMERELADALAVLERLAATLGERLGPDAPSLGAFGNALDQARTLFDTELYRRGARRGAAASGASAPGAAPPETAAPLVLAPVSAPPPANDPINDRIEAYALLDEVAGFLQRLEPHSPVPYLIRRAAEWGQLNAVELYHELFLRLNGQINIFEMMGLESPGAQARA